MRKLSCGVAALMEKKHLTKAKNLFYKDRVICEQKHIHGFLPEKDIFLDFLSEEDSERDKAWIKNELHENQPK